MTKKTPRIRTVEDLEIQERKLRLRLKETEKELGLRFKQMPEEIVTSAFTKLLSNLLDGKLIKSLSGFAKKIGKTALFKLFEDSKEQD